MVSMMRTLLRRCTDRLTASGTLTPTIVDAPAIIDHLQDADFESVKRTERLRTQARGDLRFIQAQR